jgi:hypothetical protein
MMTFLPKNRFRGILMKSALRLLNLFLSPQTGWMSPVCTIAAEYCEKFIDGIVHKQRYVENCAFFDIRARLG